MEDGDNTIVERYKKTNAVLGKHGLSLKSSKLTRNILKDANKKPEEVPEETSPQNLGSPKTPKKLKKTPVDEKTPRSKKAHRLTFDRASHLSPAKRDSPKSKKKDSPIRDLGETPLRKNRSSRRSLAKDLFKGETGPKSSNDPFDPDSEEVASSPVIKFTGSSRAFNKTTGSVENTSKLSPKGAKSRRSIGNGRAEKIMSLLEQSVDSIELAKKKKKEKDLKKQCLENNLRVKISKLDIQILQDEGIIGPTESTEKPPGNLPVAQSTLSKTNIKAAFHPAQNESTISNEDPHKTVNNTSLDSHDEIPLDFTVMSAEQKWKWILSIPKEELKNQDWDRLHDFSNITSITGVVEEFKEILNNNEDPRELEYKKLLYKHKLTIWLARNPEESTQ